MYSECSFFMYKLQRKPTSTLTQKNAPRQKMILPFLCILHEEKALHLEVSFQTCGSSLWLRLKG